MDWSLCQPNAKKRFLRDVRGYKVAWPYYTAMIIDPILRFNWVFFIMYTHDLQHSSIASFLIALSDVSRRGMGTLPRRKRALRKRLPPQGLAPLPHSVSPFIVSV